MRGARRVLRALCPLDTSDVDAALDRYDTSTKKLSAHARVLRMNIDCQDCGALVDAVKKLSGGVAVAAGPYLRGMFGATSHEPVPVDMEQLLNRLD